VIEIAIDEIVLHDVPVADVAAFGRAVEASLAALAADYRATKYSGQLPDGEAALLHGARVDAGPDASPGALGAAVAGSVWRAIVPAPAVQRPPGATAARGAPVARSAGEPR
jgi:hypothetical protein